MTDLAALDDLRLERAMRVLAGVGDPDHEWSESTPRALHIRRRLTPGEAAGFGLRDIRRTQEAKDRFAALPAQVRRRAPQWAFTEEVGL